MALGPMCQAPRAGKSTPVLIQTESKAQGGCSDISFQKESPLSAARAGSCRGGVARAQMRPAGPRVADHGRLMRPVARERIRGDEALSARVGKEAGARENGPSGAQRSQERGSQGAGSTRHQPAGRAADPAALVQLWAGALSGQPDAPVRDPRRLPQICDPRASIKITITTAAQKYWCLLPMCVAIRTS